MAHSIHAAFGRVTKKYLRLPLWIRPWQLQPNQLVRFVSLCSTVICDPVQNTSEAFFACQVIRRLLFYAQITWSEIGLTLFPGCNAADRCVFFCRERFYREMNKREKQNSGYLLMCHVVWLLMNVLLFQVSYLHVTGVCGDVYKGVEQSWSSTCKWVL